MTQRDYESDQTIRLRADFVRISGDRSDRRELRILGDEDRGYLLSGTVGLAPGDQEECWFYTLADAIEAAARLGVPVTAWTELTIPSR